MNNTQTQVTNIVAYSGTVYIKCGKKIKCIKNNGTDALFNTIAHLLVDSNDKLNLLPAFMDIVASDTGDLESPNDSCMSKLYSKMVIHKRAVSTSTVTFEATLYKATVNTGSWQGWLVLQSRKEKSIMAYVSIDSDELSTLFNDTNAAQATVTWELSFGNSQN